MRGGGRMEERESRGRREGCGGESAVLVLATSGRFMHHLFIWSSRDRMHIKTCFTYFVRSRRIKKFEWICSECTLLHSSAARRASISPLLSGERQQWMCLWDPPVCTHTCVCNCFVCVTRRLRRVMLVMYCHPWEFHYKSIHLLSSQFPWVLTALFLVWEGDSICSSPPLSRACLPDLLSAFHPSVMG